ncbi:HET domain protein [Aspergillus thermomutatus]|uniref:Heterokaryon incompatibility domain-containing protein n=1 Tax=Aspergillus thermomutatus TaxID=41047 RepID=A0A397HVV4_ASPTH|nr:uncharacterized protein CDV56_109503 [Aspergillus thermomutatus]RHZ67369.1 hypothetical protein CDV56_109503 [Aspergillus thermomutatus]
MTDPTVQALSRAQVAAILDQNTYDPTDKHGLLLPIEMRFRPFSETGEAPNINMLDSAETKARLEQWCRDGFVILDPKNEDLGSHVEKLDDLLSPLMVCSLLVHTQKWSRDEIIDRACALLARLPSYPPELPFEYAEGPWPEEYFVTSSASSSSTATTTTTRTGTLRDGYEWSSLRVLSRPSTNVVRIALFLVMQRSVQIGFLSAYLDTITTLLDTATELLLQSSKSKADARARFVLQAFLWATWHQTMLIQLWYDAKIQMRTGSSFDRHSYPVAMPGRETVEKLRPNYMCKWAFELLRSDLSSVTQDFRRLFEIYNVHFGDREPRCNLNPAAGQGGGSSSSSRSRVCDGKAPGNCQRFESEGVQIQSAHDFECPGSACSLLTWDEQSYKNIKKARAVSLEETDEKYIRYCPVSTETMAVSHVWSHGQGGRPETGFNICLHRRFTRLARALGCTSYWMDTPCVPTDLELRYEAMGQINNNFLNSKVTLLVDRDLMEINVHPLSLEAKEAIVATLVVCDWNVRAWTLLEGMRGRWDLHILCKDNHVISLVDVLNDVLAYSNLTLVSPCLALQHYIPTGHRPVEGEIPPVKIEQATCLLNHRHATKDRDVTLIWSLVCGSKLVKASVDFWKSKMGDPLATGFLVSSAPRLQGQHGFSWAPSRPNLLPPTAGTPSAEQYPAYDGEDSLPGMITEQGFRAEWLMCLIGRFRALPTWIRLKFFDQDQSLINSYYTIYNEGGTSRMDMKSLYKLRSVIAPVFKKYRWVGLLLPAVRDRGSSGSTSPPRPFQYQGEAKGRLLVIAGSNDDVEWEWQFVHEWDTSFQLPEFALRKLLMV